jgi:hypothetical protein
MKPNPPKFNRLAAWLVGARHPFNQAKDGHHTGKYGAMAAW